MKNLSSVIRAAAGETKAGLVIKDARYFNVYTGKIERGDIAIEDGTIAGIGKYDGLKTYYTDGLIVPGFIDGHVHIESSMTTPFNFAQAALERGTTTVVCDPHEIANVAGEYGIEFMMRSAKSAAVDIKFMLPSCVPATSEDENYKPLRRDDLKKFVGRKNVIGLAEVMDAAAVLGCDADMLGKLALMKNIDGHAPGVSGKALCAYTAAGIGTDHECTTLEEAYEKLSLGQYVMIRQGTAAKNLRALYTLAERYPTRCMFVTDDVHPEDLLVGHIDGIVRKAIELGVRPENALVCATLSPATCFGLSDRGAIAPGKRADLIVLDEKYNVKDVFCAKKPIGSEPEWNFCSMHASHITSAQLEACTARDVIGLVPGQLLTTDKSGSGEDKVKLFALERHHGTGHMAACYLSGYGIKRGAVATSIAHDSHNIIAAGFDDDIVAAVNELIDIGGGIAVAQGGRVCTLPLRIGGIMSDKSVREVADMLKKIKRFAYELGVSKDVDPFMSLSFLSLPVIPSVRLLPSGVVRP